MFLGWAEPGAVVWLACFQCRDSVLGDDHKVIAVTGTHMQAQKAKVVWSVSRWSGKRFLYKGTFPNSEILMSTKWLMGKLGVKKSQVYAFLCIHMRRPFLKYTLHLPSEEEGMPSDGRWEPMGFCLTYAGGNNGWFLYWFTYLPFLYSSFLPMLPSSVIFLFWRPFSSPYSTSLLVANPLSFCLSKCIFMFAFVFEGYLH